MGRAVTAGFLDELLIVSDLILILNCEHKHLMGKNIFPLDSVAASSLCVCVCVCVFTFVFPEATQSQR